MEIKRFVWDTAGSNSWLIVEKNNGMLIDAVDSQNLYEEISGLDELTVVLTHSHFDHITGLNKIREIRPDTRVIATAKCSEYLGNPFRNMSATAMAYLGFYDNGSKAGARIEPFVCGPAEQTFEQRSEFTWHGHRVVLMAVYGHSDDSQVIVVDDTYVFSGDTILPVPTVTRFPTGSTRRFWEEDIPLLRGMHAGNVFPGHGAQGSLGEMIAQNKRPEKRKRITK